MADSFKPLGQDSIKSTRTLLHESIPITGTLVSGTYNASGDPERGENIKVYSHGMFQSVYDYPYVSSSANHIFDITAGFSSAGSSLSGSALVQKNKKINIYNQMAQVLNGYDTESVVRRFDADGDLSEGGGTKHDNTYFFNFSRLLVKDEIKKGSFSMVFGTNSSYATPFADDDLMTITDTAGTYKVNSPAGEYGILKSASKAAYAKINFTNSPTIGNQITILALQADASTTTSAEFTVTGNGGTTDADEFARDGSGNGAANFVTAIAASPIASLVNVSRDGNVVTITQKTAGSNGNTTITSNLTSVEINGGTAAASGAFKSGHTAGNVGLVYYQAGISVLTSSIFSGPNAGEEIVQMNSAGQHSEDLLVSSSIDDLADSIRHRIKNISFNNTTELNSTHYFCRVGYGDFNYSSNPTYIENSKIRVKKSDGGVGQERNNIPVSYITTVGLYSQDNELLAVAKLSEPLRNDPTTEMILRVRLDY